MSFQGLETRGVEGFAFDASEERGQELKVFESVVGSVEYGCGLLPQGRSDDGLEDDDREEWCFGSDLSPDNDRRDG